MLCLQWTDSLGSLHECHALLAAQIVHTEGGAAQAHITRPRDAQALAVGAAVSLVDTITRDVRLRGWIVALPEAGDDQISILTISTRPPDYAQKIEAILAPLAASVDPLFVGDPVTLSLEQRMDATLAPHASVLHWNRQDNSVRCVGIFETTNRYVISGSNLPLHLEWKRTIPPITRMVVDVVAEWVQHSEDIVDLAPAIAQHFPEGKISSFTGTSLMKGWPKSGSYLGQHGYRVVRSSLRETDCSLHAPPTLETTAGATAKQRFFLTRRWYEAQLWVQWRYRQRREERVRLIMTQAVQGREPSDHHEVLRTFHLGAVCPDPSLQRWSPHTAYELGDRVLWEGRVFVAQRSHEPTESFDASVWDDRGHCPNPLGDPSQSSFFTMPRGIDALGYAIDLARADMLRSARSMQVVCEFPLAEAWHFDLHDTLEFYDERLPGGWLRGRVHAYTWIVEPQKQVARLTLACASGRAMEAEPATNDACPHQAPFSHLRFSSPRFASQPQGIADPQRLTRSDLVESVRIIYGPEDQWSNILTSYGAQGGEPEVMLASFSTQVHLHLCSLRGCDVLSHAVDVPMIEEIRPPCDGHWSDV